MRKHQRNLILVILIFWCLTSIYNNCGSNNSLFWVPYIMILRESFLAFFLYRELKNIKKDKTPDNIIVAIVILFSIGMSIGYSLYRFYAAICSATYKIYKSYMDSDYVGLIISIGVTIFLLAIYFTVSQRKSDGKG